MSLTARPGKIKSGPAVSDQALAAIRKMKEIDISKREELIERREKLKTKISLERSLNGNLNCRDDEFEFFEKNNISYKVVHLENINDDLTKECYLNYLENSPILQYYRHFLK